MTSLGKYHYLTIVVGLLSLLFLSPQQALVSFIVLGQAHFALGYLYRFKAGKVSLNNCLVYLILFLLIFSLPSFLDSKIILAITALLFSIHFFFDEARIFKGDNNVSILLIIPPVLLFFSSVLNIEMGLDLVPVSIGISALIYILVFISSRKKELQAKENIYINAFTIFFILIYLLDYSVSGEALFGSIILMHIFTWYLFYHKKTWSNRKRNRQYLIDVLVINLLLIGLYCLYDKQTVFAPLAILFNATFYYCWAILHIITSSGTLWDSTKNYFRT